jgi:ribonucleotide reductase alpha subunit
MPQVITEQLLRDSLQQHYELAAMVSKNKYQAKGERSFQNVLDRMTHINIGLPFPDIIQDGLFIPAGSILSGLGTDQGKCSLSNCYLTPIKEDSLEGIFEAHKEMALTSADRGGTGLNANIMRPDGTPVNNAAKTSSGAVSFLPSFNICVQTIGQNGRRGALIVTLDVRHPDILDFINAKANPQEVFNPANNSTFAPIGDLSGMNLSVAVTDAFMKAVIDNQDWDLIFPDIEKVGKEKYNREWTGDFDAWPIEDFKVYKTVKAREIWEAIQNAAHKCGDPGIYFMDKAREWTITGCVDPKLLPQGCNPCITGDTMISVADGRGQVCIKELAEDGKDIPVYCYNHDTGKQDIRMMRNPRKTRDNVDIVKVELDNGSSIKCTPDHRFYVRTGKGSVEKVEASKLGPGDSLVISSKLQTRSSGKQSYWRLANGTLEHRKVFEAAYGLPVEGFAVHHKDGDALNNTPENLMRIDNSQHNAYHMVGDGNPMRDRWDSLSEEAKDRYRKKMSKSVSGLKNGRAYSVTNESIKELICSLISAQNLPLTIPQWKAFAKENNLPTMSNFRQIEKVISECNVEMGVSTTPIESCGIRKREWIRFCKLRQDGVPDIEFINYHVVKVFKCEKCAKPRKRNYGTDGKRIKALCPECARKEGARKISIARSAKAAAKTEVQRETLRYLAKKHIVENKILPTKKDMFALCKENGLKDFRLFGYEQISALYNEFLTEYSIPEKVTGIIREKERSRLAEALVSAGLEHNHKVVSVTPCGKDDVYNGTVDDFHNYGVVVGSHKKGNCLDYIIIANCGEQPLSFYENCLLGAIPLHRFITNPFTDDARFNYNLFDQVVYKAVFNMNKFSEINRERHPLKAQREKDEYSRRIGLEVTGVGDALAMLGAVYGSEKAVHFLTEVFSTKAEQELRASIHCTKQFGCCPALDSLDARKTLLRGSSYLKNVFEYMVDTAAVEALKQDIISHGLANTALGTMGPCGSISIMSGNCTSGIEPVFKFAYSRKNRIDNKTYSFIHRPAAEHMLNNLQDFLGLTLEEAKNKLHYVEAEEVPYMDRIAVQAAVQTFIDSGISSTINLPNSASPKVIGDIFLKAWENELKGITVFRDGCKEGILSGTTEETKATKAVTSAVPELYEKELLDVETATRHRVKWKKAKLYIIVSKDDEGAPVEVFAKLPVEAGINGDGFFNPTLWQERTSNWDLACRLISMLLRFGSPLEDVIKQLQKSSYTMVDVASTLKRVLSSYMPGGSQWEDAEEDEEGEPRIAECGMPCPECQAEEYIAEGGCMICLACGFTTCG